VLVDRNGKPLKGIATTKNFPVQKFTFVAEASMYSTPRSAGKIRTSESFDAAQLSRLLR
jgi:hypothetical protein